MKLKIEIECDNDAFAEEPATEIIRILKECIRHVGDGADNATLRDANGNNVGFLTIEGDLWQN